MPLDKSVKLQIKIKKGSKGARGTEAANELVNMLTENWEQLQDAFNGKSEEEQEALMTHFESINEDLGDCLFGSSANPEDI